MVLNLMGFFVKNEIVHIRQVDELLGYWVIKAWENVCKPIIYGVRKEYNMPESWIWFEYLYNEMRNRKLQQVKIASTAM